MTKENLSKCSKCRRYCRLVTTFLFSHIGLCGLVVGYSLLGAFTFEALEAGYERTKRQTMVKERENVVMGLWSLTATSSVLSEKNWSALATETLQDFEVTLVKAVRKDGYDGKDESPLQWTFSGALLYSIIVITTIGYGNVAPKTPWGKVVTIFYAIIGIPLLLLCLSNIGDAMAHSFKFLYWKVCCYFCIRPKRHRKRKMNSSRVLTVPYRTQIVQQPPLPPPQLPSPVPESPELPSNSTYHTAQTSGSPTISSCKSTPRHEVHQMLPFTPVAYPHKTECMSSPYTNTASHDISYYPPRKVTIAPVITNRYAMQDDVKVDSLPLQIRKKEETAIGPGIFSIMNSRNNENFHYGNRQIYTTHDGYPWKDDYPDADQNSIGCLSSDQGDDAEEVSVPMWLCFAVVIGYICGGAVLFTFWEKWNFLDSSYFCFVTLTTIGFGDLVPGTAVISDDAQLTLGLCSLYLLFGMALLAMSFNLVQEEVTRSVRSVGKRIGIISDDEDD
ncbi:hypothetical protein JTE90_024987 [Oedothorax gibbosus]|uniref:Potassium channel domain-containing protein n=1 Tax=Oedothorax gibbosus TaxID=931172 RepID=A0AAV6VWT5_9ARAC|nr:hypothetical protein JTE90_024987 [Oedothorax gibbosus]